MNVVAETYDDLDQRDIADIGLALWRRERPEIDCSGKAVTGRVLRLGEVFMNAMNANLAPFGVPYSYYAIVGTLRSIGRPYRMSPTELQNTLMITSGGVSNLLKKVEKLGYIRRMNHPKDGRGVIVELTESGFALSEVAMVAQADCERRLVTSLSKEEQKVLAALLKRLVLSNAK